MLTLCCPEAGLVSATVYVVPAGNLATPEIESSPEPRYFLARCLLVAAFTGLAHGVWAQSLSFQQALDMAVADTPTLRAYAAQVDAARHSVSPAGELPDPKLAVGVDNLPIQGQDRFSLTREAMTMQRVTLMQDVPNSAKREARIAIANGRVELAQAQERVARITVLRETASAWIARHALERQLARLEALSAENALLANAIRAQLAGGKGLAADAIMPRQEAAMIAERRDELTARHLQTIANLRRWLGDASGSPLAGDPPEWQLIRDDLAHGLSRHPDLALFGPRTKVLEAELLQTQAGKRPDWGVDLSYQRRGPEYGDMVSVQLRFDLPIFSGSRQEPQIAAAQAELVALDAQRENSLREYRATLDTDWADYERLRNALQRQRQVLIPLAEEKVLLTTAAWRGGKGALADVIAARRERIDADLRSIAIEGERQQLAAKLHYTYGDFSGAEQ